MSYELNIETSKTAVIAEVNKTCAYTGARTITQDGKNLYNNISTDKYTAEMLERFWYEACALIVQAGKDFVKATSNADDIFDITFTLPDKYNTALDGSIKQLVFSYIVWYILANWLEVCGMSELAQSYMTTAQLFLKQLDNLLYSRTTARASIAEGAEGSNQLGDLVDSMAGNDSANGDETENDSNNFGDSLPQNYGNFLKVQRYDFAK